ncbi:MAG: hypothetical protein ABW252_10575 [Polyangiales bacterium]
MSACALSACAADGAVDSVRLLAQQGDAGLASPRRTCLAGTGGNYLAAGPYAVKRREIAIDGLGSYTVFHPDPLEEGCPHPIVAWGNGTGVRGANLYAEWHEHAARWGIVTIAAHDPNASSKRFLEGGIDYLLQASARSEGDFAGKLSTRAGTAGHSQGGEAANIATQHPNVQAEVAVAGYGEAPRPGVAVLCETGSNDFANIACTMLAQTAQGPAFLADHQDADHGRPPTSAGRGTPAGDAFLTAYTAWFRCFLADDQTACDLFRGDPAPLCSQAAWAQCVGKDIP